MLNLGLAFNPFGEEPAKPAAQMRVGIYCRKSNKDEEGKSKSIAEQEMFSDTVRKLYEFGEEDTTQYSEDLGQKGDWFWRDSEGKNPGPFRPELTRLMRDIEAGKIDVVIVWRSDRLARDNGVGDAIAKFFRKHGVRLICGGRDVGIDTSSGLFQFSVESANNRRWRDQISEDIIRDKQLKMMMHMFVRDPSCLGLRSQGKGTQKITPVWEEIDLVNRIFRMFVIGEDEVGPMGLNAICTRLMNEGVRVAVGAKGHKPKHPEQVHTSQIRTILTNCEYIGKFRYKDNEYDCPALLLDPRDGIGEKITAVPVALFEAAQEKLRLTTTTGTKSIYGPHMLTGFTVCGYCGRPLHVHYRKCNGKQAEAECRTVAVMSCDARKPPWNCKWYGMRTPREEVMNEWVITELAPFLVQEIEEQKRLVASDAAVEQLASLEQQISRLRQRETDSLSKMVGVMDAEQITRVAGRFRSDREALVRKAEELRARVEGRPLFPDLSPESLTKMPQQAIKDALRRIIYYIAVTAEGVVVLTRFGTYIAARFIDLPEKTYFTRGMRIRIESPSAEAALRCTSWFPSPKDFVRGRRDGMGTRTAPADIADWELLPGVFENDLLHAAPEDGDQHAD